MDLPYRLGKLPVQSLSASFAFPRCEYGQTDDWVHFLQNFDNLNSWIPNVIDAFPALRQLIVFSLGACTQDRYVIDTDEDRGRHVVKTELEFEGPWSFGYSYYVEEVPNEPTCLFNPSLSTSRATTLGIGPANGRLASSFFESMYAGLRGLHGSADGSSDNDSVDVP